MIIPEHIMQLLTLFAFFYCTLIIGITIIWGISGIPQQKNKPNNNNITPKPDTPSGGDVLWKK